MLQSTRVGVSRSRSCLKSESFGDGVGVIRRRPKLAKVGLNRNQTRIRIARSRPVPDWHFISYNLFFICCIARELLFINGPSPALTLTDSDRFQLPSPMVDSDSCWLRSIPIPANSDCGRFRFRLIPNTVTLAQTTNDSWWIRLHLRTTQVGCGWFQMTPNNVGRTYPYNAGRSRLRIFANFLLLLL